MSQRNVPRIRYIIKSARCGGHLQTAHKVYESGTQIIISTHQHQSQKFTVLLLKLHGYKFQWCFGQMVDRRV